jgi:hypothetical protein
MDMTQLRRASEMPPSGVCGASKQRVEALRRDGDEIEA